MDYYEQLEDEELTEVNRQFEQMDDDLEDIKVSLQKFLLNCKNVNSVSKMSEKTGLVKLPDVSLPEFDGSIEHWFNFRKQFDNLITNNTSLNDTQKLFYLHSALRGKAKDIETSEDTFDSLMQVLINRFENERLIVSSHIMNILNFEKLCIESSSGIRNLIDVLTKSLRGLSLMKLEANKLVHQILINIVIQKLDKESRKQYEMGLTTTELPKWEMFIEFLEKRSQILENLKGAQMSLIKPKINQNKPRNLMIKSNGSDLCVICKKPHAIYRCNSFLKLSPVERFNIVKKHKLCLNCLTESHKLAQCQSKYNCRLCQSKHNYLLCRSQTNSFSTEMNTANKEIAPPLHVSEISALQTPDTACFVSNGENCSNEREQVVHSLSSTHKSVNKSVLLSTARVWVWSPLSNSYIQGRVILDSGSQSHLITTEFASKLGLTKQRVNISISGLSDNLTNVKYKVCTKITNGNNSYSASLTLLMVSKITDLVPSTFLDIHDIEIPDELVLADPEFTTPSGINMLIGAELFFDIVRGNQVRTSLNSLIFQNSAFGYVACGCIEAGQQNTASYCGFSQISNIEKSLERFWQIEEVNLNEPILSEEAKYCEEHFRRTHKRDATGRYIVTMPMKEEVDFLGDSKRVAETRLRQLNHRLQKNPHMHELYKNFMSEYENLDHMERVEDNSVSQNYYYLPHHGVYRPDKTTTKLRVVFNASSPISSGQSLNDFLLKGEVNEDIFDIIIRFRTHKYAFTTDIKQMFRQITIEPSQRDLLRILWSDQPNKKPTTFRLKTVTYGTACAPFLAIRTLKQLAQDEESAFPLASEIMLRDIYMDDILSGAQNLELARELQLQLESIFKKAGMQLHKWTSNSSSLLNSSLDPNSQEPFLVDRHCTVKTLGMNWHPQEDYFLFKVDIKSEPICTKKNVLSVIARLYDPLGLLGPIIAKAKIMLQKLWLLKLRWDDPLPEPIAQEWSRFVNSLKCIENLKIPRYILAPSFDKLILLGYADASESAYGASVYMQCQIERRTEGTKLIASKSRVAPIKTISIPRLELSACLLLSQLIEKVRISLRINASDVVLHTDSMIALAWINTPPYKLKTFIGNRVSKIQTLTENYQWRHIASELNPADILSRGLNPPDLLNAHLWWNASDCIEDSFVNTCDKLETDLISNEIYCKELKPPTQFNLSISRTPSFLHDFLTISNCFLKLIRIFSFLCRFIYNTRSDKRHLGPLTNEEIELSKVQLIKLVQVEVFSNEIKSLIKGDSVKSSQVSSLHPFLDKQGIISVGGRLKNSNLEYNQKFPILLPKNHKLTIMRYYHNR